MKNSSLKYDQNDNYLQYEENIEWIEDIKDYPWVRSSPSLLPKRQGLSISKIKSFLHSGDSGEIVVGYADLSDDAPPDAPMPKLKKHFKRRIFTVHNSDYKVYRDLGYFPSEAVITASLKPKFEGVHPKRYQEYLERKVKTQEISSNEVDSAQEFREELEKEPQINTIFPDEVDLTQEFREGAATEILVNSYERDLKARQKCIDYYGSSCSVCNFNFSRVFGQLGEGFIHVHHLRPISEIGKEYIVEPIEDLRPVCPNCHAMIHRRSPPLSIQEMKNLIQSPENNYLE